MLAVATGGAILRYHLYDIDPVINNSLVFGAMAALVTGGYAVIVTGVGRLVGGYGTLLSLLATGLVAVAFEPLRQRVQRLADRVVCGGEPLLTRRCPGCRHISPPLPVDCLTASAQPSPTRSERVR
ncbi:hypothetical protein [Actinoplanes awajinensis]|uniref:Uncharacterized protein n=1 Tax=Actinoplanes awajinensis subsp. mycoplanecinus TaxID=135947 RepID=A0A101JR73_9ACTN|nr:hypothetical protein [Actinoplanes awajinensis]KUL31530.1 hypothetical protein ADL15_21925 [Actinoplanes awajinensis subsp. mycoplanecinus]